MKGNEMEQSIVSSPPSQDSRPMHSIEITHKVGVASGMQPRSGPTIFSSSLPVKLNFTNSEPGISSTGTTSSSSNQMHQDGDMKDSLEDVDSHAIDNLLPDDEDELLAGIIDDFDLSGLPNQVEDLEEYDLFGSGGGLELDFESPDSLSVGLAKASILDNYSGNGNSQFGLQNGLGAVAGEHPFGEHPSRTLFVRNINSNVEDSELRNLFEAYGAIRTLYTACKHRGFVMISYYDIRSARTAMRALQNKPLRRRKLDIHFSIPKDNPSDKDINQGTLVVFNLDPSVSNDDLRQIFGAYGEVKEIRETPHKRHHKFIEFYDVRAAEAALRSLNRSDIAGKRIKLEPSRPGGARRNLMQQMSQDLEADDTRSYRHPMGSPITNSPPGSWAQFSSPIDNAPLHSLSQPPSLGTFSPMTSNHMPGLASPPSLGTFSPMTSNHMPGLASILAPLVSASSSKIAPIGKEQVKVSHTDQAFSSSSSAHGTPLHSHSFPEHSSGMMPMGHSPGGVASFGPSNSSASGIGTLTGPQFLWGSPTPYSEHTQTSAWPSSSLGHSFPSNGQQSYSYSRPQSFLSSSSRPHQFHVGSAPSGVHLERHFGYFPESPETSYMSHLGFGGVGLSRNEGSMLMGIGGRVPLNSGVSGLSENGSPSFRLMPSQRLGQHMFIGGGGLYTGQLMGGGDAMVERGRTRRADTSANQIDSKKQYQLDLDKIINGEDIRTTLMIKNIPNKYTSKMLLAAIDENHRGTYDFLYLPIDFKNKCNVGYAFINMMSPNHIIPFYQAFNGKKWEKFNSEKVASLAYARIQGKAALVTHFQNSSLMNEDKRCRPILFHSEGPEAGDQEPFPLNSLNVRLRSSQDEDSVESPTKANNSVEKKS